MQSMLRTRFHRFEGAAGERQTLRRLATFADKCLRRLEQHLGGALFKRKPEVELTVLGHAVHPYLQRIAENADLAREAARFKRPRN
jgi:hypothetical protein